MSPIYRIHTTSSSRYQLSRVDWISVRGWAQIAEWPLPTSKAYGIGGIGILTQSESFIQFLIYRISNVFFLVLTLQPPCIFLWIRFISQSANFSRFKQLGVTFSGGLRTDASGNHSFIFLRRMGGFAAAFWYSLSSVNVKSNNVACFFDVNVKSNTVACFFD